MIRIDHLIFQDFSTNPVLSDMILDVDNLSTCHRSGNLTADVQRDHASLIKGSMVSAFPRDVPWRRTASWSLVVTCGFANFERTSFATRVSERFGDGFAELYSMQDYDKFADSLAANDPQVCTRKGFVHDGLPSFS